MLTMQTDKSIPEQEGYHPLRSLLGVPIETERFMSCAIKISTALSNLHYRDIIHKNISPDSILINSESGDLLISDSSLSSLQPNGQSNLNRGHLLDTMFAYMSPEQTGRMNRIIDHRSDLYSLGIVLYEMATGMLPFQANDALGWVHCHIARSPHPPIEIIPALPAPISDIIMKLLAKATEDRYQTAHGLKYDLEI